MWMRGNETGKRKKRRKEKRNRVATSLVSAPRCRAFGYDSVDSMSQKLRA